MDIKSTERYLKKFQLLVDSCYSVEAVYQMDIAPSNQDNPLHGYFWREGAFNGAFFYFLRSLEGAEYEIHRSIMEQVKAGPARDGHLVPKDYIDVARAFLTDLGYSVRP